MFSIGINGTGYQVLHSFQGGSDGSSPYAGLTVVGSALYGTTLLGGYGVGSVFSINPDGTGYEVLYSFGGTAGEEPWADLVLNGSTLIGTCWANGSDGDGTLFSLSGATPTVAVTPSGNPASYTAGMRLSRSTRASR